MSIVVTPRINLLRRSGSYSVKSNIVKAIELLLKALESVNDKSTRLLIIEAINELGKYENVE